MWATFLKHLLNQVLQDIYTSQLKRAKKKRKEKKKQLHDQSASSRLNMQVIVLIRSWFVTVPLLDIHNFLSISCLTSLCLLLLIPSLHMLCWNRFAGKMIPLSTTFEQLKIFFSVRSKSGRMISCENLGKPPSSVGFPPSAYPISCSLPSPLLHPDT